MKKGINANKELPLIIINSSDDEVSQKSKNKDNEYTFFDHELSLSRISSNDEVNDLYTEDERLDKNSKDDIRDLVQNIVDNGPKEKENEINVKNEPKDILSKTSTRNTDKPTKFEIEEKENEENEKTLMHKKRKRK